MSVDHSVSDAVMTSAERRAGASLAAIFALRMLGLFLILPVFAAHAHTLQGGEQMAWVGLAIGIYGLTQAVFQIPFGSASDRWGRKPVIIAGLCLFILGSALAALADHILWVVVGRALQGAGAISAAVTALAADLSRDQHRTKIMAMIGSSIALMFALSMVGAPLLYAAIGMTGIFWLTALLALLAIVSVMYIVPNAPPKPADNTGGSLRDVFANPVLMRLNLGAFCLHLIQMTMWVVVPVTLVSSAGLQVSAHWKIYLPAVLVSIVVMVPTIIAAERKGKMKTVFISAIALLIVVQSGLGLFHQHVGLLMLWLTLFFIAFNVLEATLPSWITREAPQAIRGKALGVYNTLQSIGIFCGGALGGILTQYAGSGMVHSVCAIVAIFWLWLAVKQRAPQTAHVRS